MSERGVIIMILGCAAMIVFAWIVGWQCGSADMATKFLEREIQSRSKVKQ